MSDIPSSQSDYKFVTFSKANPLMKDFVFTGDVALPKPGDKLRIEPIAFINECAEARLMLLDGKSYVTNMDGTITGPTNLLNLYWYGKTLGLLKSSSITEGFDLTSTSVDGARNEIKNQIFTQVSEDTIAALYNEVILKYGYGLPIDSSAFGEYLVNALKETEGYYETDTSIPSGDYLLQRIYREWDGTTTTSSLEITSPMRIIHHEYSAASHINQDGVNDEFVKSEEWVSGKIKVDIGLSDLLEGGLMSCGVIAICEVSNHIYKDEPAGSEGGSISTDIANKNVWVAFPLFDNVDIESTIIETDIDVKDIAAKAISNSGGVPPQQNANALGSLTVYLRSIVSWRRLKYTGNIDEIL